MTLPRSRSSTNAPDVLRAVQSSSPRALSARKTSPSHTNTRLSGSRNDPGTARIMALTAGSERRAGAGVLVLATDAKEAQGAAPPELDRDERRRGSTGDSLHDAAAGACVEVGERRI